MKEISINFKIKNRLECVSLIGKSINKICSTTDFSDLDSCMIELCVVEAINNSIKHAYKNDVDKEVEIILSIYQNKITVSVCDTGRAMKPEEFERDSISPIDSHCSSLENLPESGFGLYIIKAFMDEISYQTSYGKNVLTMTKFFKPPSYGCRFQRHQV